MTCLNVSEIAGVATQDNAGLANCALTGSTQWSQYWYYDSISVPAGTDQDVVSLTQIYASNSMSEAFGFVECLPQVANEFKLRLYMNGVQVAESAYLAQAVQMATIFGNALLSGSNIVKISLHNYSGSPQIIFLFNNVPQLSGQPVNAGIFAGSVKVD